MRPEPCLERTENVHRREGKVCAENPGGVFCAISIKRFFILLEENRPFFSLKLEYSGDRLIRWSLDGEEGKA